LIAEPVGLGGAHFNEWFTILVLSYNSSGSMMVHKLVSLKPNIQIIFFNISFYLNFKKFLLDLLYLLNLEATG
jgi:hypothetical protein